MKAILNTLFVMTERSYLHLDHDTVRVEREGATALQVPLHHIGNVVCFGEVFVSPALLFRCAEDSRSLVFLDRHGRFKARMVGPTLGNVLLRIDQHATSQDLQRTASIARNIVAAKIQNARKVILRGAREATSSDDRRLLDEVAGRMGRVVPGLQRAGDLDHIRGLEGEAARAYFGAFDRMVRSDRDAFRMQGRTRRPPLDRINALLSFLYTLLLNDCVGALEGVGLDPQIGFLHAVRPGRPALALDLLEELRAVLADRLALTLINRQQLTRDNFVERPGGAVHLDEDGRKTVLVAFQKKKQEEVAHKILDQKIPWGLVAHVQARLMARHLRGELEQYPPFVYD